jgi:hypothetical protein
MSAAAVAAAAAAAAPEALQHPDWVLELFAEIEAQHPEAPAAPAAPAAARPKHDLYIFAQPNGRAVLRRTEEVYDEYEERWAVDIKQLYSPEELSLPRAQVAEYLRDLHEEERLEEELEAIRRDGAEMGDHCRRCSHTESLCVSCRKESNGVGAAHKSAKAKLAEITKRRVLLFNAVQAAVPVAAATRTGAAGGAGAAAARPPTTPPNTFELIDNVLAHLKAPIVVTYDPHDM